MISWAEAKQFIGEEPVIPDQTFTYYAYKKGEAQRFPTHETAKAFSQNIEKVCTNEQERAAAKDTRNAYIQKVFSYWQGKLKEEYSDLVNRGIFDVVYKQAYDQCTSSDYDAIEAEICDLDEFLDKVFNAYHIHNSGKNPC